MKAAKGDRIVIASQRIGGAVRDAEVLEVEGEDGSPPYRIRWAHSGQEALIFPGRGAYVDRAGPSYPPEYDRVLDA